MITLIPVFPWGAMAHVELIDPVYPSLSNPLRSMCAHTQNTSRGLSG